MFESRCDSENLFTTQKASASEGDISQRQVVRWIILMYGFIRICTIFALVMLILSVVFGWSKTDSVSCVFMISLVLSFIVDRLIGCYRRQISQLGFVTEVAFILGVIFLLIDLIFMSLDSRYFEVLCEVLLALFAIFSFVISPVLGIIHRIILVVHREAKSVRITIAEMVILVIPVIIVAWLLLRFG